MTGKEAEAEARPRMDSVEALKMLESLKMQGLLSPAGLAKAQERVQDRAGCRD